MPALAETFIHLVIGLVLVAGVAGVVLSFNRETER